MKKRLILCRTPLQSLLVPAIQQRDPASDTILYQPTSPSTKHKAYFDRMVADHKYFVSWRTEWPSHFLAEIRSYFSVPEYIRSGDYEVYLISSVGSLASSLLINKGREIHTYDDGMFNLLDSEISSRVDREPWHHRLVKRLTKSLTNAELLDRSSRHYTIFPSHLLPSFWRNPVEIPLFGENGETRKPHLGPVTVLLGTYPNGFNRRPTESGLNAYRNLCSSFSADVILPHPAEGTLPQISDRLHDRLLANLLDRAIAEEIIMYLWRQGYDVQLYGFSSTALSNLAGYVTAYNIVIPGFNDIDVNIFEKLGVRTIEPSDDRLPIGEPMR